jgi:hypothetical protein
MHRKALAIAALAVALWCSPPIASADPVVPQADTPCSPEFADAMTSLPNQKSPLVCAGNQWKTVTSPYPISDRWLSYGPPMKLHGEGLRNASIRSGNWTAVPQDANSGCRAEQIAVVNAGVVGPPKIDESAPGQQLSLAVVPKLFSITMSGYCLWTKVGS